MELKFGYKQTEIGPIPEEWDVKSFGDLFDFRNGVNADKHSYGQGVPFINVLEPITYSHIHGPEIPGRVTLSESLLNSYEVRRGDVLFNRTSETQEEVGLASTYLGSGRVVFGGFVISGRPKNGSLDPLYSGYALRAPVVRSQIIPMGQGAIRANISQQNLKLVLAPVPPLPEQQNIAAALNDVDVLLDGLERLIAKKRDLKQAAMQQLLTGQTRLPGFTKDWPLVAVSDLLRYERPDAYMVRSSEYQDTGTIPVLTANKSFILGYTNEDFGICTDVPAIIFDDFTTDIKYVDFAFKIKSSAIKILRGRTPDICLRYVFERMNLLMFPVAEHKRYYISEYQEIEVPIPDPDEQAAIAAVLADMDAEIAELGQRLAKTRDLKQAMMEELLTGRTRLVAAEEVAYA